MWAVRKILRIPYTCHVTNVEVRATTGCHPLSHLVTDRRLRLFGHIARRSLPQEDHHHAVAAMIRRLPPDWKRPSGKPSHTWLCAVEADLGQQNIGLASAWRKAAIRDDWRRIVDTAMLQQSKEDHHHAVAAMIQRLPPDWKRPSGKPSHTLLCAVEADLGQQNIGLASAWRKAAIRDDWRHIVDTAMLQQSTL